MLWSPSPFGSRWSHQTQEPPSEFLPAALGIPQGASRRSGSAAVRALLIVVVGGGRCQAGIAVDRAGAVPQCEVDIDGWCADQAQEQVTEVAGEPGLGEIVASALHDVGGELRWCVDGKAIVEEDDVAQEQAADLRVVGRADWFAPVVADATPHLRQVFNSIGVAEELPRFGDSQAGEAAVKPPPTTRLCGAWVLKRRVRLPRGHQQPGSGVAAGGPACRAQA